MQESAASELAKLLVALPKVTGVPNAQNRLGWLANPVATSLVLWRHYVTCAFSSQEQSVPDTPLGRFANGHSPLLDLQLVIKYGTDLAWFATELKAAHKPMTTERLGAILPGADLT